MTTLWQTYHTPSSVEEAVQTLAEHAGNARIIAGGTDLMIDLQFTEGHPNVDALVDVTRIPEMTRITEQDGWCIVGAATTHTAIVKSHLLETRATCLVESCGVVGGPQVRNVGTLGGNVAHALPAADGTTSLMALDTEAEVAWGDGRREWLPLAQLFKGPGISALDTSRDVLVAFRFKLAGEREGSAFKRIMRPQGVALPVLGCAVWVRLDESRERYEDVRICISPVAPTPVRAEAVEAVLRGQLVGEDSLNVAVETAYESLHPRTSKYRATGEYREYMMETLLRRALPLAAERARTGEVKAEGVGMG
ncbi:MAG TPA: FAD binding domain-containing protein [Oceanobacillus sp.]|nr:FAD binding domain-containing protein [Oceanobacillus sp.]